MKWNREYQTLKTSLRKWITESKKMSNLKNPEMQYTSPLGHCKKTKPTNHRHRKMEKKPK